MHVVRSIYFCCCCHSCCFLLHPSSRSSLIRFAFHRWCYYYYYWFVATHCVCDEFFSHFVSFRFRNVCQYFVPWRRRRRRRRRQYRRLKRKKKNKRHTQHSPIYETAIPKKSTSRFCIDRECIRLTSTCVRTKLQLFTFTLLKRRTRNTFTIYAVYHGFVHNPNKHMGHA